MPNLNVPVEADDLQQWKIAAARAGATLKAWVIATLSREAERIDPNHKPARERTLEPLND